MQPGVGVNNGASSTGAGVAGVHHTEVHAAGGAVGTVAGNGGGGGALVDVPL